jgi:hypothetical protein
LLDVLGGLGLFQLFSFSGSDFLGLSISPRLRGRYCLSKQGIHAGENAGQKIA